MVGVSVAIHCCSSLIIAPAVQPDDQTRCNGHARSSKSMLLILHDVPAPPRRIGQCVSAIVTMANTVTVSGKVRDSPASLLLGEMRQVTRK